jgi:hypothetical protein
MSILTPQEQWLYGLFGGGLIALSQFILYAFNLPNDACPPRGYKCWMMIIAWALFVLSAGLITYICDPHIKFVAVYEGASTPALFFLVAHHYSQWAKPKITEE